MAKPLSGRSLMPALHPADRAPISREKSPTTINRRIDETSSRRRIGRTHPTHACLPVHKGFESMPTACGAGAVQKSLAISARYQNAIGVLQDGGDR